ncbi:MAG: hypothetical protein K6F63_07240 [Lachnospiraceae bacterium]|nr:hypothetical protein [Lachnospiraceae bacterium]
MEKSKREKIIRSRRWELIRQLAVFLVVMGLMIFVVTYVNKVYSEQSRLIIKQNATRAAVECYSVEGLYPPNIEYLEQNYSFTYNSDKYFIFYETFASNVMPTIEVYERK